MGEQAFVISGLFQLVSEMKQYHMGACWWVAEVKWRLAIRNDEGRS